MGYYSSLINRKFKDVVGSRYEDVLKEYREFLLTEEDVVKEVKTVLMPLDIFVSGISEDLYKLFRLYDAEVTLVYITDKDVVSIVSEILGEDAGGEYIRKKEDYGHRLLEKVSSELEMNEVRSKTKLFSGHKWDDIENLSEKYDMVAISKSYGGGRGDDNEISPVAQRLVQQMSTLTVLY
ncbi:hypothetical protein F1737_01675 [Methanoplanus sp. FWC-SCC4]|uniref:Uncharacterized protein n=1 Tax=Methanochimaera problematica TaxID=2609417 RepID=A0AA97I1S8_9EURY|nr:hypothetical protein [Methanoplanus sp. FWC-SCC4]WOF15480.1 hypothetical protein F1737_01675 [Methanoplanus sp. FWC-SCC4]